MRNRPFLDCNKRTGSLWEQSFLAGMATLHAPQPETANVILAVAAGTLAEEQLTEWIARWI